LIAADRMRCRTFARTRELDDFNDAFDGPITSAEKALCGDAVAGGCGAARFLCYEDGLLAGEAYADGDR